MAEVEPCESLRSDKTALSYVFYWISFCLTNVDDMPQHPYSAESLIKGRRSKRVNRQIDTLPLGQIKHLLYEVAIVEINDTGCPVG